ncbi:hypothetical protein B0H13DRAFT_1088336 [Mycena leptocephala]|nr:hypothetical protein B0H13DRAFT_1088336 [Mycena leptocephala]
MSAGTTAVYKLDLDDIAAFPDTAHVSRLPPKPGESWIVLGEILDGDPNPLSSHPLISPFFLVRDRMDCIFSVALSRLNSTGWQAATAAVCKIGHVLCISSGVREHLFGDSEEAGTASGSLMHKYVIENPSTLFVLPCSMAQLYALNRRLRDKSEAGEMELCNACKSHRRSAAPDAKPVIAVKNAKLPIGSKVDIGRSVRLSPDCTFGIAPIGETARNQVQVE